MKCSKCGAVLKEGILFCPVCGGEIQWVPEYSTIETLMHQQKVEKGIPKENETKKVITKPEEEQAKEKKKKRKPLVFLLASIGALIAVVILINQINYNSFDYQMGQAESAFSNKDYEKSMDFVERALSLEPYSTEANLLLAEIYISNDEPGTALPILKAALKNDPDNADAYGQLLRFYEEKGMTDEIKALMSSCENEKILKKYEAYICNEPQISLDSGSYMTRQEVILSPANETDTIYYTLDGSVPDENSREYQESIELEEGTTLLRVLAVNEKGITSDMISATYTLTLQGPETPKIAPSSGEYEKGTKIQLADIPKGCKAYYAFDKTPTASSNRYRGPVTMPEGEHIFSVIFIDENGKVSNVASETYAVY